MLRLIRYITLCYGLSAIFYIYQQSLYVKSDAAFREASHRVVLVSGVPNNYNRRDKRPGAPQTPRRLLLLSAILTK